MVNAMQKIWHWLKATWLYIAIAILSLIFGCVIGFSVFVFCYSGISEWQTLIGSLIGALIAVLGAVLLFWLETKKKDDTERDLFLVQLSFELRRVQYGVTEFRSNLDGYLAKGKNNKSIFMNLEYPSRMPVTTVNNIYLLKSPYLTFKLFEIEQLSIKFNGGIYQAIVKYLIENCDTNLKKYDYSGMVEILVKESDVFFQGWNRVQNYLSNINEYLQIESRQ